MLGTAKEEGLGDDIESIDTGMINLLLMKTDGSRVDQGLQQDHYHVHCHPLS